MPVRAKQPQRSLILLDRRAQRAAAFAGMHPRVVASVADVHRSFAQASKNALWVSYAGDLTDALVKRAATVPFALGSGLFIHALDIKSIPVLSSLFRRIAFTVDGGFIPAEELAEVLAAENRADLFIGGFVNNANETITLWRGNLKPLTVPFSAFEQSGVGTAPNFDAFSVIDCGQTVKLGNYEAAANAVLYECDPAFRRAVAKKRLQEDRSFGAALRRLRKQRGLRREDFDPDLAAKTIARIEQGKVTRIQDKTLKALGKHLAVEPHEIKSF